MSSCPKRDCHEKAPSGRLCVSHERPDPTNLIPESASLLSMDHYTSRRRTAFASGIIAPRLYDGEVAVDGASYFSNNQAHGHASRMTSVAHMNCRFHHHVPEESPRFPSTARSHLRVNASSHRMSFSDDQAPSPVGMSPTTDGAVLPTLSTMLHHTYPAHQWPRHESRDVSPTMPANAAHAPHRRAPHYDAARQRTSSWEATSDELVNSRSHYERYSQMHIRAPMSEGIDDPMELSPRERSGSTTSSSQSARDDNQEEDLPKCDSPSSKPEGKTSRYLREMDRRAILERLARGEKQATLAKEYNVSRAAICNLFKHRHEVMARTDEDPFAKHPKKRKNKKTLKSRRSRSLRLANSQGTDNRSVVTPPNAPSTVNQVHSDSVLLLLTVMSDRRSNAEEFRRASERVLWLLIEEALSAVPIKLTQVNIAAESKIMGVTTEHPPCAISMEQHNNPMLEVFHLLEPERPYGQIRLLDTNTNACSLVGAHLPPTLKYHNVFLFDIAVVSIDTVRAMIECAKERGALEVMIYVVALFISSDVVEALQQTYPHVRVVTTQIESNILEPQKNRRSCVDVVLGRFDQVYQTQYTVV